MYKFAHKSTYKYKFSHKFVTKFLTSIFNIFNVIATNIVACCFFINACLLAPLSAFSTISVISALLYNAPALAVNANYNDTVNTNSVNKDANRAFTISDASDELFQLLNNTTTMRADFVQTTVRTNARGAHGKLTTNSTSTSSIPAMPAMLATLPQQKTTGKMALLRPGKFRWETQQPTQQLIIANGRYAWVYDVDLEQVTKQKINTQQPGSPAELLSGSSDTLRRAFSIKRLTSDGLNNANRANNASNVDIDNVGANDGDVDNANNDNNDKQRSAAFAATASNETIFELRPKIKNNMYSWIQLLFVNAKLQRMTMEDNLGQRSRFDFTNVIINSHLGPQLFTFTAPRGVDVIDNTQDE